MTPTSRRPRILFIAEAVTLAHVGRALTLARTLDPSRFDVHLAWDPRYNSLLGALSLPYEPVWSLPTAVFLERLATGAPMHDAATLERYVDEDRAAIARVGADVVVGDFRISLAVSAKLACVPAVMVANAYWSPFGRQTYQFPEYEYPLHRIVGDTVAQRLFHLFRPLGFAAHTRPLNMVRRRHGLPSIGGDIREMYTHGDRTAYADIPALVPTYDLPSTHRYVGAVLWSPAGAAPSWWATLPTDRPVIYTSLGSSGDAAVLEVVLDAMADLPVTVIAATTGRTRIERPPANAYVSEFLPGTEAAARAALVICNGGSSTTYQALASGVPVLDLVSNNMDQHLNMAAIRGAGAGVILRARGVTAAALRATTMRMLDDRSYAQRAAALADAHSACRAEVLFPALVEDVLAERKKA